jgi:hypothetical protein
MIEGSLNDWGINCWSIRILDDKLGRLFEFLSEGWHGIPPRVNIEVMLRYVLLVYRCICGRVVVAEWIVYSYVEFSKYILFKHL